MKLITQENDEKLSAARELRRQGMSYGRIGKMIGKSGGWIQYWIDDKYHERRLAECNTREYREKQRLYVLKQRADRPAVRQAHRDREFERRRNPEIRERIKMYFKALDKKPERREYNRKVKRAYERHRRATDPAYRESLRTIERERMASDLQFRLSRVLRNRIRDAIKKPRRPGSAVRDLGCTIAELKTHLESRFQSGMTWENYGKWHIDHIRPLDSFDLTDREQFLQAVHWTNLQPLWAIENIRKGDKHPENSCLKN